jgi:hypothetical protein
MAPHSSRSFYLTSCMGILFLIHPLRYYCNNFQRFLVFFHENKIKENTILFVEVGELKPI